MKESTFFIQFKNYRIFVNTFLPEQAPKAIIQVNHGLAEHSGRYQEFARFLCQRGYAVYLHDHPGHGQSVLPEQQHGCLPWKDGWDIMLGVIHSINKTIRKAHPQTPVFLMGHSMGSLLARYYNATFPMYFKGMIISGTTNPDPGLLKIYLNVVRSMKIFNNEDFRSPWFNQTFYRSFNKKISSPATPFDWLSSNPEHVQKYINDPLCGFPLSLGFYKNLFRGTLQMLKAEKNLRFRKNFSILIISGKEDPTGQFGKDPAAMLQKYIRQGFFRTQIILLDGRHELLNESPPIALEFQNFIEKFISDKLLGIV